ncbi:MAG: GTP pyrophosphokinase family protein [Corynebacterium flavescens]|uniref:GTP pyrophosphokinase n=1 Tax=Corynebacterium flavescens TaxID=28028 RepID=UPI0026489AA4|nr:GTP pyrophosphokinase family protein [Corynebacterium flavescens]MDN6235299.1 GTP pyrophosphokinase family protein [Corynebacterium flavescens]
MADNGISKLGNQYHEWLRAHPTAAVEFGDAIEDLLNDAGVIFDRVSPRVKGWPSLKAKAKKRFPDGTLMYPRPWEEIHDVLGVRVTVFHSTAIPEALEVFGESFKVIRSVDKAAQTRTSGGLCYGSHHLILTVTNAIEELSDYEGLTFEVQIRTVLQHAWAEFEHDIRYKQGPNQPSPQVDRLFTLAAGLIELADQQFDEIAALKDPSGDTDEDVELNAETLPGVLAVVLGGRFPRSRSDHYRFLSELLEANDVTSLGQLQALLNAGDIAFVHEAMHYRFRPGQVRLIDDLLLNKFGKKHIDATWSIGDRADRRRRLNGRFKNLQALRAHSAKDSERNTREKN